MESPNNVAGIGAGAPMLEDVLKSNHEEHLYEQIMALTLNEENDPPVIFGWQNLDAFVQATYAAQYQAAHSAERRPIPDPPFAMPEILRPENVKEILLDYLHVPGAPPRLDKTCLPCSVPEFIKLGFRLQLLDQHPWTRAVVTAGVSYVTPIAQVYIPKRGTHTLENVTSHTSLSLWG